MKTIAAFSFALCCIASAAHADIAIERHILQKGIFINSACKPDASDPSYDACKCQADIRYPVISGMADVKAQASLNDELRKKAEQFKCEGQPGASSKDDKESSSVTHFYEITYRSPLLVAFKFVVQSYSGGAHADGTVEGDIVDLKAGKILALSDLFAAKDLPAINKTIYDALSVKPEGEVFRDEVEKRKGAFVTEKECGGCTLTLSPEALNVVFQAYEIAPYAAGNVQVPIPTQYVSYPAVVQALAEQKNPQEGKK